MVLSLLNLPDDVLLAVLAYLSPKEVFGCRVVCRRLRDLCLHRELWKTVRVSSFSGYRGVARAALRLAPCLRKVSFADLRPAESVVPSTVCVVAELSVLVRVNAEVSPAKAVVQKLGALGGLRALELQFGMHPETVSFADPLLDEVYKLSGLQQLVVSVVQNTGLDDPRLDDLKVSSSLKKLRYSGFVDPFLELLLRTHGPTLYEVHLITGDSLPISLLREMPRLRSLQCHLNNELVYSDALSELTTLHLNKSPRDFPPNALDFLRQAPNLRSLSFSMPKMNPAAPLQALATSPSACVLEVLVLSWEVTLNWADLNWIGAFLPRFPSLRSLSLESCMYRVALDDLLRAVSPTSAPSLTSLSMWPHGCAHAWLHGPAVHDLLARNPRLHLHVKGGIPDKCDCQWCRWRCHVELRATLGRRSMASHCRTVGCPTGCCVWPW